MVRIARLTISLLLIFGLEFSTSFCQSLRGNHDPKFFLEHKATCNHPSGHQIEVQSRKVDNEQLQGTSSATDTQGVLNKCLIN